MEISTFPTRLADLSLNDSGNNPSLYVNLESIRKSALSIPNRIGSILEDAKFAKRVSHHYGFPLVANERCGSWYIDPADKVGSAYFKSTDGHHGQWDFSARRLNLQLLPILDSHGGAVVVDSTRRGKNMPDAFSKTVPIWVAVLNRALFPQSTTMHRLQSPPAPDDLGASELSQIEARLDTLTQKFLSLTLDIPNLRRELKRPILLSWAVNGHFETSGSDIFGEREQRLPASTDCYCHHLILCSASRRVRGAEASEGGYVQGAGDDSEGWSHGLSAQLFWEHKALLLQTPEGELPVLIESLIGQERKSRSATTPATRILPASNIYVAADAASDLSAFDLVINCQCRVDDAMAKAVHLYCRSGKLGSKDLRDKLPVGVNAVRDRLTKHPESQILITCATGTDLSAGVAVAVLCLLYNDEGRLREASDQPVIDKQLVKQRLAWITCSKPDVNPSRATLQAVNSLLMPPPTE